MTKVQICRTGYRNKSTESFVLVTAADNPQYQPLTAALNLIHDSQIRAPQFLTEDRDLPAWLTILESLATLCFYVPFLPTECVSEADESPLLVLTPYAWRIW